MIKAIARWFIKDEIDSLNNSIAILEETEQRLEAKVIDHDALELRLRIAEMYANDDDALIELVGLYEIKKKDSYTVNDEHRQQALGINGFADSPQRRQLLAARQSNMAQAGVGSLLGGIH